MARVTKNGNLSGAIGNIVFVIDGDRSYARSIGKKPKQTKNTIAEADKFGWAGVKEKLYRDILTDKIALIPYQYQAVKHAARLRKTVSRDVDDKGKSTYIFQNPEALTGFDFNPKMEWERCTNFYPQYRIETDNTMLIHIPDLAWGNQIKPPKNATKATLNLYALSTDLNLENVDVKVVSSLQYVLGEGEGLPAQDWVFDIPEDTNWLLIIGMIDFESNRKLLEKTDRNVGTYLWAQSLVK